MITPRAFIDFLSSAGRPLTEINHCSGEVALTPDNALKAIALLSGSQVAILGGDVLSGISGKLTYTCEDWFCEQKPGENPLEFVRRSQSDANEFVGELIARNDEHLYVVLVFSELGVVG